MDIIGFFKERWHAYPVPLSLCGIFYGALCIFSLVMGIYTMCSDHLNMIEMNQQAVDELCKYFSCDEKMLCIYFRALTFIVGIIQGLSSTAIWKGGNNVLYGIALGFTIFSLLSCSSKLLMSINAFSIVKIILYILVLYTLLRKDTRALLCKPKATA